MRSLVAKKKSKKLFYETSSAVDRFCKAELEALIYSKTKVVGSLVVMQAE